ncbi:MAG: GNAT family N-acetyltransferase [Bdellovibrionia bacterium]
MESRMTTLKPVKEADAAELFELLHGSNVTDTILWDGPDSLDTLRRGLKEREELHQEGKCHQFTIVEVSSGKRIGSIDIRPYDDPFRGDMGLWIGLPYQGKGYATNAVKQILKYGFESLRMQKIEAKIFLGNVASRRVFEKCGFQLEGTIRRAEIKRGKFVDEWLFGILKEEARY